MSTAPIGIIGGTFDPVHYGHLRLAEELGETLKLGEVRLVPSGTPPHRSAPQVAAEHRLAMVRLAAAGNPGFRVDEREMRRAGPGDTFDTLTELRSEAGVSRPLVLLLGADAFLEFATWHRWHEIFKLAHIAVAHRPGFPVERWSERMPQPLAREYTARLLLQPLDPSFAGRRHRRGSVHRARHLGNSHPQPVADGRKPALFAARPGSRIYCRAQALYRE